MSRSDIEPERRFCGLVQRFYLRTGMPPPTRAKSRGNCVSDPQCGRRALASAGHRQEGVHCPWSPGAPGRPAASSSQGDTAGEFREQMGPAGGGVQSARVAAGRPIFPAEENFRNEGGLGREGGWMRRIGCFKTGGGPRSYLLKVYRHEYEEERTPAISDGDLVAVHRTSEVCRSPGQNRGFARLENE